MAGESELIANGMFAGWYPDVGTGPIKDVDEALNVIIAQGEGAIGHQATSLTAKDAIPGGWSHTHPFIDEDTFSHVERFETISEHIDDVTTWPLDGSADSAQQHLSAVFAQLLENLRTAWNGGTMNLEPMFYIRTAVSQVYQAGEIPTFAALSSETDLATAYAAAQEALAP